MRHAIKRFLDDEKGTASIEFVILFPFFFGFFLMTYEAGIFSVRQVVLEHGVDVAVREVRLGNISYTNPTLFGEELRTEICDNASILPDCLDQIEVEVLQRDMTGAWTPLPNDISCRNRTEVDRPEPSFIDNIGSNELGFLRVCIRIDPFIPSSNLGKAFVATGSDEGAALTRFWQQALLS
ncbi:pilus assembly protein [Yoonia sp. GPGPB17]|uniref:TadE/TadG family type IV pilus assembly protein n=1 Tax=Yoonia sp. GPGPB17 TaxID=3026147 RepID=UPI0030C44DF9